MGDALEWIDRLVAATNAHDLEGLVDCFADDYVNVMPAHPTRGFGGREQVRKNWSALFATIPDISVRVLGRTLDGDTLWTEWGMSGTRCDGAAHRMCGVILFGVVDDRAKWARFYLEPVDEHSGDADEFVRSLTVDQA